MNDKQIEHMVTRFLGWKLPEAFRPDAGISFEPTYNGFDGKPIKRDPSGTNLFDASQAEAMVRYMVEGMPSALAGLGAGWVVRDAGEAAQEKRLKEIAERERDRLRKECGRWIRKHDAYVQIVLELTAENRELRASLNGATDHIGGANEMVQR